MKTRAILICILALFAASCGTETGNPGPSQTTVAGPLASSQVLENTICAKLNSCYPSLSVSACDAGIPPLRTLPPAFGLGSSFGTYSDLIADEEAGSVSANATTLAACISDLNALSCGSAGVTAAYNVSSPSDFSDVPAMIPTSTSSCGGVY